MKMNQINRREEVSSLPTQLYIEPTNRCNSNCSICVRTFYKHESIKDLSFGDFKSIVDQFPRLERVVLHGIGEPLLNRDILKMVSYLKSRGTYVLFNSNATLLNKKVQQGLIDTGLDEYRVSIDSATPETYQKMRGIPLFPNVVENVTEFVKLKKALNKNSPKISLWFVGTHENITELPDLIKMARDMGVKEVYLQRLTYFDELKASGLARENMAIYKNPPPKVMDIIEECQDLATDLDITLNSSGDSTPIDSLTKKEISKYPWQNCLRPWNLSYITANGNVLPCCISPFTGFEYEDLIMGNVFKNRFKDIWNSEKYRMLRNRLLSTTPPQYCIRCGDSWSL
jgi:radical SAM protein with 4Fe4S-binding SPASM domain